MKTGPAQNAIRTRFFKQYALQKVTLDGKEHETTQH